MASGDQPMNSNLMLPTLLLLMSISNLISSVASDITKIAPLSQAYNSSMNLYPSITTSPSLPLAESNGISQTLYSSASSITSAKFRGRGRRRRRRRSNRETNIRYPKSLVVASPSGNASRAANATSICSEWTSDPMERNFRRGRMAICSACQLTVYPSLCVESLFSYPGAEMAEPLALTVVGLRVALISALESYRVAKGLLDGVSKLAATAERTARTPPSVGVKSSLRGRGGREIGSRATTYIGVMPYLGGEEGQEVGTRATPYLGLTSSPIIGEGGGEVATRGKPYLRVTPSLGGERGGEIGTKETPYIGVASSLGGKRGREIGTKATHYLGMTSSLRGLGGREIGITTPNLGIKSSQGGRGGEIGNRATPYSGATSSKGGRGGEIGTRASPYMRVLSSRGREEIIALKDCMQLMHESHYQLRHAIAILTSPAVRTIATHASALEDALFSTSAALTYQDTCVDGLHEWQGDLTATMTYIADQVSHLVTNALNLVSHLKDHLCSWKTPDLFQFPTCS